MNIANNSTIQYYSTNADRFYKKYKQLPFEEINSLWIQLIPSGKLRVLDVGAGSGRDAAWFAKKGHEVIAVEPADGLRGLAEKKHSNYSIQWMKDGLPGLQKIRRLRLKFELILLNAVWMHITPKHKEESFDTLINLLSEGGKLMITLRHGTSPDKRIMHPVCKKELIHFSETKKIELLLDIKSDDLFGRTGVSWETIVYCRSQGEV